MNRWVDAIRSGFEGQSGRFLLWWPLFLGLGIAAYFKLPFEPKLWILILLTALVGGVVIATRHDKAVIKSILIIVFIVLLGGLLAKLRTERVAAPIMDNSRNAYGVEAMVVDIISADASKPILLLAPFRIKGLRAEETPLRLRVSLTPERFQEADLRPGDSINAFMIVHPPPSPAYPGGYDFARKAYFQGIGGVGFIPSQIEKIDPKPVPWPLKVTIEINRFRWDLTRSLRQKINLDPNDLSGIGGFGAALVTGHQAYLQPRLIATMRTSGLAHILSISGVHMAIVGGFLFFTLRALMALWPWLALRVPIKKWAALGALAGVVAYLLLSGQPTPAIRAAFVAVVAFGAILFDRQAMSLRSLSLAALLIMVFQPEAVTEPGFQMSFAATAALLALYESYPKSVPVIDVPLWFKTLQAGVKGLRLTVLSSLVASVATLPFGIAYFNRVPVYGVVANLLEGPISTFWVMPSLALGTVFSGTKVGEFFLFLSAWGLNLIAQIAAWVSAWPFAVITHASGSPLALSLSAVGLFFICLWKGKGRWLGLLPLSLILWWPQSPAPHIWLENEGANAVIIVNNRYFALRDGVKTYGPEQLANHYNLIAELPLKDRFYECKSFGCLPKDNAPQKVGFWFGKKPPKIDVLQRLCETSNLVVIRSRIDFWPPSCQRKQTLDARDFQHYGSIELTRASNGWHLKSAQILRGQRPWSRHSDAEHQ